MENTSPAFKVGIISTKRKMAVKAVLQTADATIYNLGSGDIVAGSLSVNSACFQDGIELGSTMAADCSISLNNADGAWNNIDLDGATLWPYSGLVLPDTTTEYVSLGTFIIDEPGRPYSQLTLQALDRMILLDEPFSAVVRTFPATNTQVLTAISAHCNVPLASSISSILNASYSITTRPTDDITCRDIVGMIALMAAGFARMTRDGELEIVQLPNLSGTIAIEMPVGSRYEGFKQTSDAVTVTGLTYADTDETVQLGTDAYSLQVDQIPILQNNRDTILQSIFAVISGYTYTGFACPYPGNPAIDAGDSVRHITMDGKTIVSLVASHNFLHGGKSTMEATAKSQSSMSYKGANARRLSTIAAKIQTVDTKLSNYQQTQAQFTDLLTQAMGYFVTEELQEDGSTIHYEHDHPLLADSVVIYKKTATTMSWTSDAGAHWYGMTAEGNILARVLTAIGINAEWVHISGASTYASGYDPSTKETPAGAQAKADAAYASAQSFVNGVAAGLQTQIDGSITTFFYAYVPLLTNVPANAWTTTAIKNQHLGDLFYDTLTGYSYRYQLVSTTYSWQRITDTDITTALANAATAQDTADHKRRVFVAIPTTPYDIGDLWAGGSAGDLKKCSTARVSGAYVAGDWTLASKYTDDTTALAAAADALTAHNLADAAQAAAVAADAVADTAIANAATAQTAANTAQTTADTATTNAATANGLLADLASDSKLTAVEKQTVKKEWDGIVSEVALNDTQATTFGITTEKTTYDTAYSALSTYITPLLTVLTTTSDIVGTTFRTNFKTYYDALTALLNAIANKARTNAAAAQTTANTAVTNAATAQTQANLGVTNAATAQTAATNAATVAAAKNKTFYTQPAPPYYVGDVWQKQQVPVAITDIVKCTVTRLTGVYTEADWTNAYTLAEIAAMGSTIISGGYIKTSLLDVVNLIAGTLTNTAANPECWATIGTAMVGGVVRDGLLVFLKSVSAIVPSLGLYILPGGQIQLRDKSVAIIETDANATYLRRPNGTEIINGGSNSSTFQDSGGHIRFYADDQGTTQMSAAVNNNHIGTDAAGPYYRVSGTKNHLQRGAISSIITGPATFTNAPVILQWGTPRALSGCLHWGIYGNFYSDIACIVDISAQLVLTHPGIDDSVHFDLWDMDTDTLVARLFSSWSPINILGTNGGRALYPIVAGKNYAIVVHCNGGSGTYTIQYTYATNILNIVVVG